VALLKARGKEINKIHKLMGIIKEKERKTTRGAETKYYIPNP